MAECPRCHGTVTAVQVDGKVLPLDNYETVAGENRYVIIDFSTEPWTADPIDPTTAVYGYTDHRMTCQVS